MTSLILLAGCALLLYMIYNEWKFIRWLDEAIKDVEERTRKLPK